MIPSSQLRCRYHYNQNVFMVDLSFQKVGNSRALCPICLQEKANRQKLFTIDAFEAQAISFAQEKEQELKQKYESENQKLHSVSKQLATLKEKVVQEFNNLIYIIDMMQDEQRFLREFGRNMGLTKLEEAADILSAKEIYVILNSGNEISQQSQLISADRINNLNYQIQLKEHSLQLVQKLTTKQTPIEQTPNQSEQQTESVVDCRTEEDLLIQCVDTSKLNIFKNTSTASCVDLLQSVACTQECFILTSNPFKSIIAGGIRCVIKIWEQIDVNLVETAVLVHHTDVVTGIVFFDSGDVLISCGLDKQIYVWKYQNQNWNVVSQSKSVAALTQLKLVPNQKYILVSGDDRNLKLYTLSSKHQLEFKYQIPQKKSIFSFSVNFKQDLLAVSCSKKYFKVYYPFQGSWTFQGKLMTEGEVHRVHFISDFELICQQSVVPSLQIYKIFKGKEYMIERLHKIDLMESDDSCINFPIFSINDLFCVKNGKKLYLIKKTTIGYIIEHEIHGNYEAGCSDTQNQFLILKDAKSLQLCSFS